MEYIYVQNDDGTPLMPTTRMRHVRTLLNKGRARIISHTPFVIRLKYHSEGITQPECGGTDPGRTRKIRALVPVSDWTLEMNKFAFMRMDDGSVYGADFQNGRMKTYKSVNDYVYARQGGRCYLCGAPIEEYHHIMPQHERGSDTPEDKVGLCRCCHQKVHTGRASVDIEGFRKKYDALSVLNQAIPYIKAGLVEMFGEEHVHETTGWHTKQMREDFHLDKDHDIDAVCIAAAGMPKEKIAADDMPESFTILQFRRHDRALVKSQRERTYRLNGETAAKNRRPRFEQPKKTPALSDWYETRCRAAGKKQAQKERSQMTAVPSARRYNSKVRLMPGTVFIYRGEEHILSGNLTGGAYLRAVGDTKTNYPARECRIVRQNTGLVFAR